MKRKIILLYLLILPIFIVSKAIGGDGQNGEQLSLLNFQLLQDIENKIIAPKEFDIDTPRICTNSKILYVEQFGLSPDNSPEENAIALEKISNKLLNSTSTILMFPKGKQYVVAVKKDQKLLDLINVHDLIVEGNNARIKFQDADVPVRGKGFFYLDKCERIVIRNISIGCDWDYKPLAVIGKIIDFNESTNEGIYDLISKGTLSADMQLWAAQAWDPQVQTRTVEGIESNFKSYNIISPNRVSVIFKQKFNKSIIGKHSLVSIKQNSQYSGIVLINNDHILIENVKFLGIPFMAIQGRDRGMTEHLIVRNCTLAPPEDDTYFSAGEGFDVRSSWYICENNTMEYCYDDIMNFDAGLIGAFLAGGLILEKGLKQNEIIADHLQHYFTTNVIAEGARFGLADSNFKPVGWESILESFEYQMNYHIGHPAPHRCVLRFKDNLPNEIPNNYIVYSAANKNGGYIIRNNVIRNSIRHAIWAGNGNGLIENNTIYQSGYPAIMVQMTSRWDRWFKGYYPKNVIIRDNRIINCNTTLRQPASIFIGGGYDTEREGFTPVDFGVTSSVLIENNEIVDSYQAALGVWSCEDIIIRNNTIKNSFIYPLTPNNHGDGAIFIKKSKNIFFLNNKVEYNKTDTNPPVFVDKDNINLILYNNKGI